MSTANAGLAKKLGYKNVRVYLDGEPAWSKEEYPIYASNGFVEKGNIVLIDLREDGSPLKGRIVRAVHVPHEKLEARLGDIPRNAPVVLYGADDKAVMETLNELRDEGYKHVSLVKGNYDGWVKSGGKIESGPIFTDEIRWVRILGKGEISVAEFKKATEGELPDTFVIDARTPLEIAEHGIFKNTVNIPLDMVPKSLDRIPKDKRIFIHCSTGARADLAFQELKNHGYNVKFLLLDITDPACDCEIIRP